MTKKHFNNLYDKLRECFYDCVKVQDEVYAVKIGIILDHMNTNKPYLIES